jgi:hypothetical protein
MKMKTIFKLSYCAEEGLIHYLTNILKLQCTDEHRKASDLHES